MDLLKPITFKGILNYFQKPNAEVKKTVIGKEVPLLNDGIYLLKSTDQVGESNCNESSVTFKAGCAVVYTFNILLGPTDKNTNIYTMRAKDEYDSARIQHAVLEGNGLIFVTVENESSMAIEPAFKRKDVILEQKITYR